MFQISCIKYYTFVVSVSVLKYLKNGMKFWLVRETIAAWQEPIMDNVLIL